MKLNTKKLVKLAVMAEISHPTLRKSGYVTTSEGKVEVYPSVGGITYNFRIGDSAIDLMADHVEPGVSTRNTGPSAGEYSPNAALNVLACIGNRAVVVTGEAKGAEGFVTGKHGGIDHVMIDFENEIMHQLNIGETIRIETFGTGLRLEDYYPDILVMNIDPSLLEKLDIKPSKNSISVAVTHLMPAKIMGAGIGATSAYSGDYDIQLFDKNVIKKYHLNTLRFGDIVAIIDSDASHGWIYREGAVTIGIIAHSNSVISGHGPGVTTILTSTKGKIKPILNKSANLKNYFGKMSLQ